MKAKDFYNQKVVELGYNDFDHWLDCSDYTLQSLQISQWTEELLSNVKKECADSLIKYEAVNKCSSLTELSHTITNLCVNGKIKGKASFFDGIQMANCCEHYNSTIHNYLTREFGIKQQAMMLYFLR